MKLLYFIIIILIINSCSYFNYKNPPVVYKSLLNIKNQSELKNFKNIDRTIKLKSKVLVFYTSYDQFDNPRINAVPEGFTEGLNAFKANLEKSNAFSSIEMLAVSTIKIGTLDELLEVSRRFGADYIIVVNSAYNYYKYSTTWGYIPIFNFIVPSYRITADLYLEADILNIQGAILFNKNYSETLSENTNILFADKHNLRMSKELNYNAYSGLSTLIIDEISNTGGKK